MGRYKYGWTRHFKCSPQVVGEIVERFPQNTAENLIREARKRASPLHGLFEWNDSRAAQQFRLLQARTMIASLRVEVVDVKGKIQNVHAFLARADRTGGFVPTLEADDDTLTHAEQACWREMNRFRAKWRGLQFARAVVTAIDGVSRSAERRPKEKPRARKRA